ncbi:MAG: HAMP domain-containing protein, partial [Acidobacteriota bacterium]
LLYLSLIRRITKPMEELSAASREIAGGRLDLQVGVTSRDEIGELAASFNLMVQRLRQSREEIEQWNRTLERRVEERTESLQQARRELEAVNEQLVLAMNRIRDTQSQMIQAEKLAAVGQMASTLAHEINNPLAGIRAALEVVVPEIRDSSYTDVLQQILKEVDRLGRTTSRLLGFARPSAPQKSPSSLEQLIESTRLLVAEQAKRRGVEIVLDLEPPDRLILIDRQLTTQALLNVLLNGLQAIEGHGTLTVRTRWLAEQDAVSITIADTGCGMTPEVLEQIFTPFFTTKSQGTGLGLYVVKDIVERQSGRVMVSSKPGEGTEVTIFLPARQQAAPRADEREQIREPDAARGNRSHERADRT